MDKNQYRGASQKSDDELQQCIDNREKYLPETVESALAELQSRGMEFSDEELKVIAEDMQARRELATEGTDNLIMYTSDTHNQIEDPAAPLLYSKRVILVFSILFSVFFGSVMLAMNVGKTKYRSNAIWVALSGFGFTIAAGLLAMVLNLNAFFSIIIGWTGAYILDKLFWKKYIGNNTLYRVRSVVGPIICGLAFVAAIIILVISVFGDLKALDIK